MFHLPDQGARVKVWPTPGLPIASAAPREDLTFPAMDTDGQVVTWDEFRYRQYLHGEIHFVDPRPVDGVKPEEVQRRHKHAEQHRTHMHAPKLPAWVQAQLDELEKRTKTPSASVPVPVIPPPIVPLTIAAKE